MKSSVFFYVLLFLRLTFAEVPYFLSSSELRQLTEKEQISYFIEIQKVIVEMSEDSSYMADLGQLGRRAASTDEDEMLLQNYLKEKNLTLEQYEKYRQIAITTPNDHDERNTAEYKNAHAIWNGYNIYHANQVSQKKFKAFNEAELKVRIEKAAAEKAKHDAEMLEAEARHKEWMKNYKIPQHSLIEDAKKVLDRIQKKQVAKNAEKTFKQENLNAEFRKIEISQMEKKEAKCLFAGWILEGDRCRGPQEFPANFHIPGVDRDKMKCKSNQFLCQPMLFGLILPKGCGFLRDCADQARPLCVNFDSSITKICQIKSSTTTHVAVELATQKDSNLFDQYRGQFYSLCDPDMLSGNSKVQKKEKLKLDVEKTCKVAREKLQSLYLQRVNSESSQESFNSKPLQK